MTDREPDSSFPGRDTYGRRRRITREGSNVSLYIAGVAAVLLVIGVLFFFGVVQKLAPAPSSISTGS
jgi:hypothetical protein